MTVTLCLEHHVPAAVHRSAQRWLYAGENPLFDLPGLERVPIADAKMAYADELRDPYLETIGRLSQSNAATEWWASHLAAKHPYPSLFSRLCALAAAHELAADGTLVVCSTPAQVTELARLLPGCRTAGTNRARARRGASRLALRAGWPALRSLGTWGPASVRRAVVRTGPAGRFALERTPGHRRRTLLSLGARPAAALEGPRSALLVTWFDERSFDRDGAYRDPHLGPLRDMLGARGWQVASLLKPLLHAPFEKCTEAMLGAGDPAVFGDLYLTDRDWRRCERRVRSFRPDIAAGLEVDGVPFAGLAREYWREHERAQVDALSHDALVAALARGGVRPSLIVFPWEGHAWEHVLVEAVRRHLPGTAIVGYDNLNFSRFALSLYPAAGEVGLRPLPDRVVTNGDTFASVLRASAFPQDRVRAGCALRHPHLVSGGAGTWTNRGFILAAGSIDAGQTIELLRKASAAFGDEFVARLHPASDARAIRAAVPDVRFADEPLTDLLPRARAMLYTYSVVPYEALAAGTPPVFVRSETLLDLDQLDPTPDVRWTARTVDELRDVVRQIDATPDRSAWEARASAVVAGGFGAVEDRCLEGFLD